MTVHALAEAFQPRLCRAGILPNPLQALLFHAALAAPDDLPDAWAALRPYLDIQNADPVTVRLLPLLAWQLQTNGITEGVPTELRAVLRYQWLRNQTLLLQAAPALRALQAAGIRALALKGLALVQHYYPSLGVRRLSDVDVMVAREDAGRAVGMLLAAGWEPIYRVNRLYLQTRHGVGFRREPGPYLFDFHWRPFVEWADPALDRDIFALAQPLTVRDVTFSVPAPADQLLVVLVHGTNLEKGFQVRWVADASIIIRQGAVDWERLVRQACDRRFGLRVGLALHYLQREFGADIPDEAVAACLRGQPDRSEVADLDALLRPEQFADLPRYWRYSLQRNGQRPLPALATLPRYYRTRWDVDADHQLPGAAASRLAGRVRRMVVR